MNKKKEIVLLRDMIIPMEWDLYREDEANEKEFMAQATISDRIQHMALRLVDAGQTILIETKLVNYLNAQPQSPYSPLPFPAIVFQLTEPIQATQHITHDGVEPLGGNQEVIAIIVGRHIAPDMKTVTDIAYTTIRMNTAPPKHITFYENAWDSFSGVPKMDPKHLLSIKPLAAKLIAERFRLVRNLVYLINNQVDLKEHEAAKPRQKTTQKEHARTAPRRYYTCALRPHRPMPEQDPEQTPAPSQPTGRHVGYEFDVIGHWRRYKSGKVVWIKSHRRGIDQGPYIPKVYTLDSTQAQGEAQS